MRKVRLKFRCNLDKMPDFVKKECPRNEFLDAAIGSIDPAVTEWKYITGGITLNQLFFSFYEEIG